MIKFTKINLFTHLVLFAGIDNKEYTTIMTRNER